MAVLAIFTGERTTKDMYDALRKEINWEGDQPPGGVFHAAAFDDSGTVHVADGWESQAALDPFVNSRLMPAMNKLNLAPPKVEVYPTHNVNAYGSVDQYKV